MTSDNDQGPHPRKRRKWWRWAGAVLAAVWALALLATARDAAHTARCSPLLAARTAASGETPPPFWQQEPETFEAILAAVEWALEQDEPPLLLGQPQTFEAILAVEVEHGCVNEDDEAEMLRQWWRSSLSPFDPRNADMWDLDGNGSLNADETEVLRQWWEADREWN